MSCIVKFRAVIFSNMLSNIEEISCCYLFPGKPLCKQNHFRAFTSLEKLTLVADETSPQVSAKCLWRLRAVQGDGRRSGNRDFAKDCLLTGQEEACSWIALLDVHSVVHQKRPNTQKNGCSKGENSFPNQEKEIIGQASVLHS